MKKRLVVAAALVIALLLMPFVLVGGWSAPNSRFLENYKTYPSSSDSSGSSKAGGHTVRVLISDTGEVEEIPVFDYICGVLAAEMPVTYEAEALKAQAVAAFSYTVYRMEGELARPGLIPEHKGAYVCTDYRHCKSYLSKADALKKWGQEWFDAYWGKLESAAGAVENAVLTYNGMPINAVFHSISSGETECAVDVWGADVPYLVSVQSLQDQNAPDYQTTRSFTDTQFAEILRAASSGVSLTGDPSGWLGGAELTQAGGVKQYTIGGVAFKGADLRELFGLRSTNFTLAYGNGTFVFTVKGYGHGVGMSQYGANELAKEGKTWQEILRWYYTGVEISEYVWKNAQKGDVSGVSSS